MRPLHRAYAAAPSLNAIADAALCVLSRDGEKSAREWLASATGLWGTRLGIKCIGPDLPTHVPAQIASPDLIARQRPWTGAYRLVVTVPMTVFDLCWCDGEPLRVMSFSRGDWEKELLALAYPDQAAAPTRLAKS